MSQVPMAPPSLEGWRARLHTGSWSGEGPRLDARVLRFSQGTTNHSLVPVHDSRSQRVGCHVAHHGHPMPTVSYYRNAKVHFIHCLVYSQVMTVIPRHVLHNYTSLYDLKQPQS
jgi:hypothetical protein